MSTACLPLSALRACLEGAIPSMMATTAIDGTPNVAYISQVFYMDEGHVALSFQFFNKTRQNILANPRATVLLLHPVTAQFFRLHLRYLRTESAGPVFESMKAQLAGIASHAGMDGVFRLLGSDIYEVLEIECLGQPLLPDAPARCSLLGSLRQTAQRLSACTSLESLLDTCLDTLQALLGIDHAMLLMLDPLTQRLYTVASLGYDRSGVGSEIALGDGVIGVAARERTPVRISHMNSAYLYSRALRKSVQPGEGAIPSATEIPYPGLHEPHSQLAVPIVSGGRLLGVLFVESPQDLRFNFEDEDALVVIAGHLGAAIDHLRDSTQPADAVAEAVEPAQSLAVDGPPLRVRRYQANNSIFIGDDYLIKGVAGAILWCMLREHRTRGRTEFSNRELRLDPTIGLPDVSDNLEARLVLLQRRLREYGPDLRLEKCGRGRLRLQVRRPLELSDVAA